MKLPFNRCSKVINLSCHNKKYYEFHNIFYAKTIILIPIIYLRVEHKCKDLLYFPPNETEMDPIFIILTPLALKCSLIALLLEHFVFPKNTFQAYSISYQVIDLLVLILKCPLDGKSDEGNLTSVFKEAYDTLYTYMIGRSRKNALYFAKYIEFFQTQFTQKVSLDYQSWVSLFLLIPTKQTVHRFRFLSSGVRA